MSEKSQNLDPQTGILYVDDEPLLTQMFAESLGRKGYLVYTANSGIEALALVQQHSDAIKLVITDVTMPDMDGLDLAARIYSMNPNMPVLLITGMQLNSRPTACPANVVGTLMKPITARLVAEQIRKLLSERSNS